MWTSKRVGFQQMFTLQHEPNANRKIVHKGVGVKKSPKRSTYFTDVPISQFSFINLYVAGDVLMVKKIGVVRGQ